MKEHPNWLIAKIASGGNLFLAQPHSEGVSHFCVLFEALLQLKVWVEFIDPYIFIIVFNARKTKP